MPFQALIVFISCSSRLPASRAVLPSSAERHSLLRSARLWKLVISTSVARMIDEAAKRQYVKGHVRAYLISVLALGVEFHRAGY